MIPRWDEFQHRDMARSTVPPWIKNLTRLLSDEAYLGLTPNRRALLHGLWLEYARTRRQLPGNTASLSRRLAMKVTSRDLEALNHAGFLTFSASKPASRLASLEVEVEVEKKEQTPMATASPTRQKPRLSEPKPRPPDPLWDTLVEVIGSSAAGVERGKWNKALKSMRESDATPDKIRQVADAYREHPTFANCILTPMALAANWTVLLAASSNGNGHRGETPDQFKARIAAHDARWKEQQ